MMRRLFYLLPNNNQASKLAVDLEYDAAIKQQNIHAVAQDVMPINGVNDVHDMTERDKDAAIEWWGWRINMAIFFIALLVFVVMLVWSPSLWLVIPMILMMATFGAGFAFAVLLPNVHINEFISSMCHGEILLMVDVTTAQQYDVSRYIHQRHPEAVTGGVCWHV